MSDFDTEMRTILSEADASFDGDTIDETGYYKAALGSLRGQGSGMRVMAWGGILIFGTILIVSIWQMLVADTLRVQIIWGVFAILTNSAQIALKLWFNMQLNRRAISQEIRRLQLVVASRG
jgi:hypothetical protein